MTNDPRPVGDGELTREVTCLSRRRRVLVVDHRYEIVQSNRVGEQRVHAAFKAVRVFDIAAEIVATGAQHE